MDSRYDGMTAEQIGKTLTPVMRKALMGNPRFAYTGTRDALVRRGLVHEDLRPTKLGYEVRGDYVRVLDEAHSAAIEYETPVIVASQRELNDVTGRGRAGFIEIDAPGRMLTCEDLPLHLYRLTVRPGSKFITRYASVRTRVHILPGAAMAMLHDGPRKRGIFVADGGRLVRPTLRISPSVPRGDTAAWCEAARVERDGRDVILYKATDLNLRAGVSYGRPTLYEVGEVVRAPDWDPAPRCGGGLHLSPTTIDALSYSGGWPNGVRFLRVRVPIGNIVPLGDDKCKVRMCEVLTEVDVFGDEL
jgi:hypothetical protein